MEASLLPAPVREVRGGQGPPIATPLAEERDSEVVAAILEVRHPLPQEVHMVRHHEAVPEVPVLLAPAEEFPQAAQAMVAPEAVPQAQATEAPAQEVRSAAAAAVAAAPSAAAVAAAVPAPVAASAAVAADAPAVEDRAFEIEHTYTFI